MLNWLNSQATANFKLQILLRGGSIFQPKNLNYGNNISGSVSAQCQGHRLSSNNLKIDGIF